MSLVGYCTYFFHPIQKTKVLKENKTLAIRGTGHIPSSFACPPAHSSLSRIKEEGGTTGSVDSSALADVAEASILGPYLAVECVVCV